MKTSGKERAEFLEDKSKYIFFFMLLSWHRICCFVVAIVIADKNAVIN